VRAHRYSKWLKYVPSMVVAVVAIISLVFSISNAHRSAELSILQVAADIRDGFALKCPDQALANHYFTVSGKCKTRIPKGYSLWIIARDSLNQYYAMFPPIDLETGKHTWQHDWITLATPGKWQMSVYLADANATIWLLGKGILEEYSGFRQLPSDMEAIKTCSSLEISESAEP